MRIMVMDGQGGGVGRSLLEALKEHFPEAELIAVGTNATATANMMKSGVTSGATGENAVVYHGTHGNRYGRCHVRRDHTHDGDGSGFW